MLVPMAAHERRIEITQSATYAEDVEYEYVDCPGSWQPVEVNPIADVFDTECPECGRTIANLADEGDLL